MAIVFQDGFSGSLEDLEGRTPDTTGTGYTEDVDTGGTTFRADGAGVATPAGNKGNQHISYSCQPNPTTADVDVELDVADQGTSDTAPTILIARWQDSSNFYSAGSYRAAASSDKRIFKTSGGTPTELASGDTGLTDGDTLKFELRGTALKLYKNGSEELSTTDSTITASGKAGWGTGDWWVSGDDIINSVDWDNIIITEVSAGGGRTTKNTDAYPLGVNSGVSFRMGTL